MAKIDNRRHEPDPTPGKEGMGKETSGSTNQFSPRNWAVKQFFFGFGEVLGFIRSESISTFTMHDPGKEVDQAFQPDATALSGRKARPA
jgi:hypothetical protein